MNDLPEPADGARPQAAGEATPAMAQYLEIKRQHPDCLVFYRMGDFYEMFFEDAQRAAPALDIALTRRGRHEGGDIPMCGVPVHAAEAYLSRLIRKGFRVAVCEQMEDPSQRKGIKGPLRRAVVRVVTPGTLTEETLLDARRHNYLAALAEAVGELGLAWLDLSTGDFFAQPVAPSALDAALARLAPGELLVADRLLQKPDLFELLGAWKEQLTPLPAQRFDSEGGRKRLESTFAVATLEGFGAFGRAELAAAGAIVDYATLTQQGKLPRLTPPQRIAAGAAMEIDAATRRNLELTETLAGERRGSLLAVIDRSVTGAGARLVAEWLAAPLTDPAQIAARHDALAAFLADERLREDMRSELKSVADIERAMARLALGRGGPRDLAALKASLAASAQLRQRLRAAALPALPAIVAKAERDLGEHGALVDRLGRALAPDLPLLARDGGFVAAGYSAELDELKALRDESRKLIASLQSRYAAETGVANLKIRHNNVLGYYIEVTAVHAPKLGTGYIHRQTMASAMRFTTTELSGLESKILNAADKALALELKLFEDLVGEALARGDEIARTAAALALLDGTAALAELAAVERWCRPEVDPGVSFAITGGRHPVVEAALRESAQASFVGNDCDLGETQRLWLVTGPNMAGKSTFLRQNALIAILAQMGSFVPAEKAALGVVDRLFSRVGAADDLARGRSTFMVEMVETAAILNQATARSLVILDEIGRGTATFDGLSIAWATVEHLHDVNRCRALFATHYHELTALASRLPALSCHSMRVKEWQDEVVFLHEVAAGAADRSYGIHVAKLAGLPPAVLRRAEEVLALLEKSEQSGDLARLAEDLPLFSVARPKSVAAARDSQVEKALAEIHPDALTPREALELLYKLKSMVPKERS
ncbi:MAG TPA: DNA mismatch repair protein MutS [Stellaceae bacterium]|nr:DNA mismatch repair protein MutS [Stellaceae bacterium]